MRPTDYFAAYIEKEGVQKLVFSVLLHADAPADSMQKIAGQFPELRWTQGMMGGAPLAEFSFLPSAVRP